MSNISALRQQAEILLNKLVSGKKYLLGDVRDRVALASADYPGDAVIQATAHVIEQLYDKNPNGIISQAELDNIFQQLVGLNSSGTRFREVLGDMLMSETPMKSTANDYHVSGLRDTNVDAVEFQPDMEIKNEFDKLFDSKSDVYNPHLAANAKAKVGLELNSLGYDNSKVRLVGGNSQFLVFAADLDTNRGEVSVLIPAESSGEKFPNTFIVNNKIVRLNRENLQSYINAARDNKLPSDLGMVDVPQTAVPKSLETLANFDENVVEASVGFPQATVRLAKRMLLAELSDMGFKGSQLRVAEPMTDGFICEAILNTPNGKMSIEVPIEMQDDVPLMPNVFAKNDYIADFTAENLHNFVRKNSENVSFIRTDSDLGVTSLSEMKDMIVKSAISGNFDSCDEVLEAIAHRFDAETYCTAVSDYQKLLFSIANTKQQSKQAYDDGDQFVKTPNSIYPIHKKLGRPAHELVRDENGVYHLKSAYYARQNQEEEGAFFSNAKTLIGD